MSEPLALMHLRRLEGNLRLLLFAAEVLKLGKAEQLARATRQFLK